MSQKSGDPADEAGGKKTDAPSRVLLLGATSLSRPLRKHGLRVASVRSVGQLLRPRAELDARAIVLNAASVQRQALPELIPEIRKTWPLVDVLLWHPNASGAAVREGLHAGATDVLLNESAERCAAVIADVVAAQQLLPRVAPFPEEPFRGVDFEGVKSRNRTMWNLFETASQVATTDASILLLGETGTGKELLARAIHRRSRRPGRFVAVNCGAIPENLIDSELFGHVEGAFTGAKGRRPGLFRYADRGTLMLDEMGAIPLAAQYRLLRVLQEETVRPVGGHEETPVDVRVIAATSSDLEADVERGRFREDLFYRLDVIRLVIPPLRERPEDIVLLFGIFARRIAEQYNIDRPQLGEGVLDQLQAYDWPGNVRQLENFTEQLLLTQPNRVIEVEMLEKLLPFQDAERARASRRAGSTTVAPGDEEADVDTSRSLADFLGPRVDALERAYLARCFQENRGRVGATARQAEISRRTLLRKVKRLGIDRTKFRTAGDVADDDDEEERDEDDNEDTT